LAAKGLELNVSYTGDELPTIITDSHRLSQVITNLVSNAIKFSEKGTIDLIVSIANIADKKYNLKFDIIDKGMGISEAHQKNLFQSFSQGDSSIARKFGGSGLGLALSKRIVEAMNGKIELVASTVGHGSHFRFELPVVQSTSYAVTKDSLQNAHPHLGDEKLFKNKSILLVEDSADNAALICYYFDSLGINIDVANNGLEAVLKTKDKKYDCILMDIQMPDMDGLEATRRIRQQGYTAPIIALTAHALPAETEKSLEAGCDLHLTKPVTKAKLIDTLAVHFRNAEI
jgi:CheY-like chemotaxis protein